MFKRGVLSRQKAIAGYLFAAPGLILLLVFAVIPILFSFYLSFHEWNMLGSVATAKPVGWQNYITVLQDEIFILSMVNTFKYAAGMVIITLAVALVLAVALNSSIKLQGLFRTVYFIPVITSMVAVSIVWSYLYHPSYGFLNQALSFFGFGPMRFLRSADQALYSVMAVDIWKRIGYYMVIFLAGLQVVPRSLYEAARIDGASTTQVFFKITIPMIKPTILLSVIVCTIEALRVFTPIYVMTKGGPANASMVAVLHMYNTAFTYLRMGRASAMAVILFVVIFVISLIQTRLMREGGISGY